MTHVRRDERGPKRRSASPLVRLIVLISAVIAALTTMAIPASAQSDPTIGGTIQDRETEQVGEGVEITVESEDGSFSETATSDSSGSWIVTVPGAGTYLVTINSDTLPDDLPLKQPDNTTRSVLVRGPGDAKTALFAVGASGPITPVIGPDGEVDTGSVVKPGDNRIIQLLVQGIKLGLIIGMAAIGLSLVFGTTGLVNFAHGEMVTIGAVTAFFFNGWMDWRISLLLAGLIATIFTGFLSGIFDMFVWNPLRRRGASLISMLVVSIGFSILLRYVVLYRLGGRANFYDDFALQTAIDFGPFSLPPKDIVIIFFSLFVLLMVGFLLQRTRIGKAMRAVADNRDLAESSGIDVERVIRIVWIAGGALAGLGGVLFGATESISWEMGFRLLLLMFAGVTLGGLGTAYGALLGSLVVGIFIQMSTIFIPPDTKNIGALLTLVVILLVRPQGLLGKKERIG